MTLHEAIKNVLLNFGKLPVNEITDKINSHRLYKRKDGQRISTNQISARIAKYPELFIIDLDTNVTLRNYSLISLKLTIDKIADTLFLSTSNTNNLTELLLPAFAIYLKHCNPSRILRNIESADKSSTEKFALNLVEDLNIINESEQFKSLLTKPIEAFVNLDELIKLNIIVNILGGSTHMRSAKYFTERKTPDEYDSFDEYLDAQTDFNTMFESAGDYEKRLVEYASWNVPEIDFKEYFNKLVNEFSWKKRFQSLQSTPVSIARLISAIIISEEFIKDTVYNFIDPFFGKGTLMAEICLENTARNINVYGGDLNENAIIIAKLLFAVNGLKQPIIREGNAFTEWKNLPYVADWFICDPPMTPKINLDIALFGGYGSPKNTIEAVINMALYHIHEYGKACIVVPESFIFSSTKSTMALRKKLVDNNYLDGIISLPPGLYAPYSSVKTSLIIIDKSRSKTNNNWVFAYDASSVKPVEFESVIPEIQKEYSEKYTEFSSFIFCIKKEKIVAQNYDYSLQKLFKPLFADPPLHNYFPIVELLPIIQSGLNNNQLSLQSGNSVKKEDLNTTSGIPYIQISDLSVDPLNCYITEERIKSFITSTETISPRFLNKGSIMIAKTGNNLKPTIYDGNTKILFSSSIIGFSLDTSKIDPHYFIYQLHEPYFVEQLTKIKRGVTILSFRPEDFLKLLVHVPSIQDQKKFLNEINSSKIDSKIYDEEIGNLIGELKHKAKGPLGSIKLSVKRLENYLKSKAITGEKVDFNDIAYKLLPGQKNEDFIQYSLKETFERFYLHVNRIDNYLKKAIKFAMLGEEEASTESINLNDLIKSVVIPSNHYNYKITTETLKQNKNLKVVANKDSLLTVFELFLDNAYIHGFKSNPESNAKVHISWVVNRGDNLAQKEVVITIENNGVPAKGLTIEKFISKGHTTNAENGGLGMGGPFINKAIILMGGQLLGVEDISTKTGEFNIQFKFKLLSYE